MQRDFSVGEIQFRLIWKKISFDFSQWKISRVYNEYSLSYKFLDKVKLGKASVSHDMGVFICHLILIRVFPNNFL